MKREISFILFIVLIFNCFCSYFVFAEENENVDVPEPIKVVDFSYTFDELYEQYEDFEVVENEAKPVMVLDEEMGQVLQLQKAVIKDRKFTEYFDKASGRTITTEMIESENTEYSTIKLDNPYAGLDHLVEYAPYEDVKTIKYRNFDQPLWEEGITISYWIKSPAGEDGYGVNSNVVGFTSERFQIQSDDYARYLCTVKYDVDYKKYTEEEKKALGIELCGVDRESDFYFELAEEKIHNDKPLYVYETLGRTFWMNKNFVSGYVKYEDGKIVPTDSIASSSINYNNYCEAPYLGSTEDDHKPGTSNLRYAWTYSEMWLDASSSFYFENDNNKTNKQLNPNREDSYGQIMGMQDFNCFNINSWKNATSVAKADEQGLAADSPVLEPNEWHYVTVIIQNDWVRYFLDGKEIDIEENYSSFGAHGLAEGHISIKPWKLFNKGSGARYGYGVMTTKVYWSYYGRYCSPTIMEWLTLDCVDLTIGGGNRNGDYYFMYAETDEIMLKNIAFYDTILTDDQIAYLATEPNIYGDDHIWTAGDLNLDKKITARDALLILKHVAKIETIDEDKLHLTDVNGDGVSNANDALDILKYVAGIAKDWRMDGIVY